MSFDSLTLVVILLILGILGAAAMELLILSDRAEAKGCPPGGVAFNASKGRCFQSEGPI